VVGIGLRRETNESEKAMIKNRLMTTYAPRRAVSTYSCLYEPLISSIHEIFCCPTVKKRRKRYASVIQVSCCTHIIL